MNLTADELKKMQDSKDDDEWNTELDKILKARGGKYPPDWYEKVIGTTWFQTWGMELKISTR